MFSSRLTRTDRSEIHADFPDQDTPYAWGAHLFAGLLMVAVLARGGHLLFNRDAAGWAWLDLAILLLAVAATIFSQARRLPMQNVLVASSIMVGFGGLAFVIGGWIGVPFGAVAYPESMGFRLPGGVPWPLPLIWIVVLFNARSVGRLIFRPWRKSRTYGFRVIAMTCALAFVFALALEPYASAFCHYWLWRTDHSVMNWYGAPWINFLGWVLVSLLILAFSTPFLLNKKPKKSPPFYQPLIIWITLQLWLAVGAAAGDLKTAVYFILFSLVATLSGALAGARW